MYCLYSLLGNHFRADSIIHARWQALSAALTALPEIAPLLAHRAARCGIFRRFMRRCFVQCGPPRGGGEQRRRGGAWTAAFAATVRTRGQCNLLMVGISTVVWQSARNKLPWAVCLDGPSPLFANFSQVIFGSLIFKYRQCAHIRLCSQDDSLRSNGGANNCISCARRPCRFCRSQLQDPGRAQAHEPACCHAA